MTDCSRRTFLRRSFLAAIGLALVPHHEPEPLPRGARPPQESSVRTAQVQITQEAIDATTPSRHGFEVYLRHYYQVVSPRRRLVPV